MGIEVTRDGTSGTWSFSYKRHVLVAVGSLFIGAGLATLTGPWWQGILIAFLGMADITAQGSYQWAAGVIMVLIGLAFVGYKYFVVDVRDANRTADRAALSSSPVPVDMITAYFSSLTSDHSYKSSLDTAFEASYTHFRKSENAFKLRELAKAYESYSMSASKLHKFCAINFVIFPESQPPDGDYRYCLAPDLNIDRGMGNYEAAKAKRYEALAKQLTVLLAEARTSFDGLLNVLQKHGHV